MVKIKNLISLVLCVLIVIIAQLSYAQDFSKNIVDDANVINSSVKQELLSKIEDIANNHNVCVVLVTSNEVPTGKTISFADDFYDNGGYGYDNEKSGLLYLMDFNNRQIYISTTGKMILTINDRREDRLLYAGDDYLKKKDYGNAMLIMLDMLDKYISSGPEEGAYVYDEATGKRIDEVKNSISLFDLIIAGIGLLIVFLIFYNSVSISYNLKNSTYKYDVNKNTHVDIIESEDIFINETVTRTKIVSSSSSGGGSSGTGSGSHTSTSGGSHGGGGRSF